PLTTTANYTLSLHDALPISGDDIICAKCLADGEVGGGSQNKRIADDEGDLRHRKSERAPTNQPRGGIEPGLLAGLYGACHNEKKDRKSTRLNSSHVAISYAV